jgi:hypothetical protein
VTGPYATEELDRRVLMTSLDPVALGFAERRPGSGLWYKPGDNHAHQVRTCESCEQGFMARRNSGRKGAQRFCSQRCMGRAARQEDANYGARHERVRRERGPARNHVCADCGQPAENWAQVHGTTGEEAGDYEPRCVKCHRAYDTDTAARGEGHGCAKLTEADVRHIRSAGTTAVALAETFGVWPETIRRIRRGENWAHIGYDSDRELLEAL